MSPDRIVVIGGSAGAHRSLTTLLADLPADLPAAVMVVIHVGEHAGGRLPDMLTRAGPLPVRFADNGDPLEHGRVLVARPGAHLLVNDGRAHLTDGPRVNLARPAVDTLFASAARAAGSAVVSVVLSGALDDGAVGSALVARAGGQTLVEDPKYALHPSMPEAARQAAPDALVCRVEQLAEAIQSAVGEPTRPTAAPAASTVTRRMVDSSDTQFLSSDEMRLTGWPAPNAAARSLRPNCPPSPTTAATSGTNTHRRRWPPPRPRPWNRSCGWQSRHWRSRPPCCVT